MSDQDKLNEIRSKNVIVEHVLRAGGSFVDCIEVLVRNQEELIDRLICLDFIAPRKIKSTDGTVLVYRCPDKLVPNNMSDLNPILKLAVESRKEVLQKPIKEKSNEQA